MLTARPAPYTLRPFSPSFNVVVPPSTEMANQLDVTVPFVTTTLLEPSICRAEVGCPFPVRVKPFRSMVNSSQALLTTTFSVVSFRSCTVSPAPAASTASWRLP